MSAEFMRFYTGWLALWFWSLAFGAVAITVVSALTIGIFVAPLALLLCCVAALRARARPQAAFGVLIGPGAVSLLIGFLHWNNVPCPIGPLHLGPGEHFHFRCGGFDPPPWLAIGVGLVAVGLVGYAL